MKKIKRIINFFFLLSKFSKTTWNISKYPYALTEVYLTDSKTIYKITQKMCNKFNKKWHKQCNAYKARWHK